MSLNDVVSGSRSGSFVAGRRAADSPDAISVAVRDVSVNGRRTRRLMSAPVVAPTAAATAVPAKNAVRRPARVLSRSWRDSIT